MDPIYFLNTHSLTYFAQIVHIITKKGKWVSLIWMVHLTYSVDYK